MTKRNFQDGQVASAQAMPNILPLEAIPAAMHAPLKICTRPHAASCAHQTAHPKRARQHPHPHSKTYRPGAASMAGCVLLPKAFGAATCAPDRAWSHSIQ